MTTVRYVEHADDVTIQIEGHAGYAQIGSDIVCAAISILVQTLVAQLDDVADVYDADIREGYAMIYAKGYEAKMAFETILKGFYLLQENYPDYIEV